MNKAIIISIPKAGTYLFSEILKEMGYFQTYMHLGVNAYEQYNPKELEKGRSTPADYRVHMPLKKAIKKISQGQFAVGHLPFKRAVQNRLGDFKIIHARRDLRDCLISYMRFYKETGRHHQQFADWINIPDDQERFNQFLRKNGKGVLKSFIKVSNWLKCSNDSQNTYLNHVLAKFKSPCSDENILFVSFEELTMNGEESALNCINRIAMFLEVEPIDTEKILQNSLGAKTLTKSAGMTRRDMYWNDFAEKWFAENAGCKANEILGYA